MQETIHENEDPIQESDSKPIGLPKGLSAKKYLNNLVNVALDARIWMQKAAKRRYYHFIPVTHYID